MAWERLAHTELSSAGDDIDTGTFTAKKSLRVLVHIQDSGTCNVKMRFNGLTSQSYSTKYGESGANDGSGSTSATFVRCYEVGSGTDVQRQMTFEITNISDKEKHILGHTVESESTGASSIPKRVELAGKFDKTDQQITRIQLVNDAGGSFGAGSYITVLGASTGSTISDEKTTLTNVPVGTQYRETDTRKMYRAYAITNTPTPDTTTSSGNTILKFTDAGSYTFTPSANFNVEYLVVGGGGGGGNEAWDSARGAGGGGAGAYRTATGFSVTSGTSYTVTVGDGGLGGIYTSGGLGSCGTQYEPYSAQGTKGEDSVFATITSNGGSGGGGHDSAGGNGCETSYGFLENGNASGGGGSNSRTDVAGNTDKGAYGNYGGDGSSSSPYAGGGGGGSGGLGGDSSGGNAGAGGNGTASSITGSSVTYATGGGGHGGSSNGTGGSSNANSNAGVSSSAGNSATSNTGSGGGANSGTSRAGKGGSGIVVLKFSTSGNTFTTNGSMGWKERGNA